MVVIQIRNGNFTQGMKWGNMNPKYSPIVCPTSFAKKCGLVLYIGGLNGSPFHYIN
jgi:hypothetical protein